MKKVFLMLTLVAGVFVFASCNQKKEATVEEVMVTTPAAETFMTEIVKDTLMDGKGNAMYLTFNNPKGLVDIVLKGDSITLMQDTTASGIKFTNAQYIYEEWQGKVTLKKDGKVIFQK